MVEEGSEDRANQFMTGHSESREGDKERREAGKGGRKETGCERGTREASFS